MACQSNGQFNGMRGCVKLAVDAVDVNEKCRT